MHFSELAQGIDGVGFACNFHMQWSRVIQAFAQICVLAILVDAIGVTSSLLAIETNGAGISSESSSNISIEAI